MKKETTLWQKKDGSKIRICDMDNDHLMNTIKQIQSKGWLPIIYHNLEADARRRGLNIPLFTREVPAPRVGSYPME